MATRIRKDDIVKIISGDNKGTTGKVLAVTAEGVLVEGVGLRPATYSQASSTHVVAKRTFMSRCQPTR